MSGRGGAHALARDEIDARDGQHFRRQVRELRVHGHLCELLQANRVRLAGVQLDVEAELARVIDETVCAQPVLVQERIVPAPPLRVGVPEVIELAVMVVVAQAFYYSYSS